MSTTDVRCGDGDVIIITVRIVIVGEGCKVVSAGCGGQYISSVSRCVSFNCHSYMYCPSLSGLLWSGVDWEVNLVSGP